jgi:hypothetical protein
LSRRRLVLAGVAGLIGTVLAAALLARAVPGLLARRLPTREAQWIWEPRNPRDATPTAFLAAQRLTLESVPQRARLLIAADQEYVLYVNGKRIGVGGSGATSNGLGVARLDAYEVAPLLTAGANRVVVELRSAIGHGGLLARLADGSGRTLLATDGTWRIFKRSAQGVIRGWVSLGEGQPAHCWGLPPIGRWGKPAVGETRVQLFARTGEDVRAARWVAPSGQRVLYDFGREVTGLLQLEGKAHDELDAALLWTGSDPPRPAAGAAGAPVLVMAGQRRWLAVRPRRLRYALVVGLETPAAARVLVVEPQRWGGLASGARTRSGVLGILAPPLRSPVEDEVWSKLESVTGVAGREKR